MRISDSTASILASLSRKHFGENAQLRLFGSRANDNARGGDIDVQIIAPNSTFQNEISFLADADRLLDERVDLRVQRGEELLIDRMAMNNGVPLHG
jgi:predicted nucleotidyltransferase